MAHDKLLEENFDHRNYGRRQELVADRKMPRRAGVARRKGNFVKKY
jgi:hypothetical protein